MTNYDHLSLLILGSTPGKWETNRHGATIFDTSGRRIIWTLFPNDAALILAMRNALPGMLAEMEDLRSRMERIRVLANDLYPYTRYDDDAKRIEKIMELSDVGE